MAINLDGLYKLTIQSIYLCGDIALVEVNLLNQVRASVNYRKGEKDPLMIDICQTSIIGDQKQSMQQLLDLYNTEIFEHVTHAFKEK